MNKKADVFIYITAILSFALMIILLTTSNSISYSLIDDYVQHRSADKQKKTHKVKDVIAVLKTQEAEAENLPSVSFVSSVSDSADNTADNEIDNLIVNILLNNDSDRITQTENPQDTADDDILKIYETEKTVPQKKSKPVKKTGISHKSLSDYHIVRRGEYLSQIAQKYNIPLKQILIMNSIHNPNRLRVGQKIYLTKNAVRSRSYKKYRIRKNDTILKIARRYGVSYHKILSLNHLSNPNKIFAGQKILLPVSSYSAGNSIAGIGFIWPVKYRKISSPYGLRKNPFNSSKTEFHKGIDIPAPEGTSIYAAQSGKVIFSGVKRGYGNVIILKHKKGYLTVYAHCLTKFVRVGQTVTKHQIIGKVGNTGKSTGPHLHFEIRKFSRPINPIAFLP